ncbi:MAG: class I SAM-dependent methyltransferase [bacterium]
MAVAKKFDPKKLAKLNDPERFKILNPDIIWDTLNLQNPQKLIDIGAGTGFFATAFLEKLGKGTIYTCDTSEVMIEWMQNNLNNKKITPLKCAENSIGLPDAIADLVYMINLHHELIRPEKMITESYRLLKPEGKIAIIDWKKEEMEQGPRIEIRVSENIIIKQLDKAGFKNIVSHKLLPLHSFITGQK